MTLQHTDNENVVRYYIRVLVAMTTMMAGVIVACLIENRGQTGRFLIILFLPWLVSLEWLRWMSLIMLRNVAIGGSTFSLLIPNSWCI